MAFFAKLGGVLIDRVRQQDHRSRQNGNENAGSHINQANASILFNIRGTRIAFLSITLDDVSPERVRF